MYDLFGVFGSEGIKGKVSFVKRFLDKTNNDESSERIPMMKKNIFLIGKTMRSRLRRWFVMVLFWILCGVTAYAQCNFNFIPDGDICSRAEYLCGDKINGYKGKLKENLSIGQPWVGMCNGFGSPDNMSWFSFMACSNKVTIEITVQSCYAYDVAQKKTLGLNPNAGVQAGLYSKCDRSKWLDCSKNPINPPGLTGTFTISSDKFIPGSLGYFYIDGFSLNKDQISVCEFTIKVIEGIDISAVMPPNQNSLAKGQINGPNSFSCNDLNKPITFTLNQPERRVNFNTSCVPPSDFNPKDSICYLWNVSPSTGRYFKNQDSTGLSSDIIFTQPGTYTISANTHFKPFYVGSCANAAAGEIISWTVTVNEPDTTILPVIYICPGTTYLHQGMLISKDTKLFESNDPCNVKLHTFKVERNKENLIATQFVCPGESFRFQGIDYFKGTFTVVDTADCLLVHKFEVADKPIKINDSGNNFICNGEKFIFQGKEYSFGSYEVIDSSDCSLLHKFRVIISSHPDFATLDSIYILTNGDNWQNKTGWEDRKKPGNCDPCSGWYGVTCENGRVVKLELSSNNLSGFLPKIFNLTELTFLHISTSSGLTGSLPDFSKTTKLRELYAYGNSFTGNIPSSLLTLNNLIIVYLNENKLVGPINKLPPNIIDFVYMNNQISGYIPDISIYKNLRDFRCDNNIHTGNIPDLRNNRSIRFFTSTNNFLEGVVPDISGATLLNWLHLNNNKLSGCYNMSICSTTVDVNLMGNSSLPFHGDHKPFCSGLAQQGAPCNNGSSADGNNDVIQDDCSCKGNSISNDSLFIDIQNKSGEKGSTVCQDVTARNFINIESIHFNFSYNATLIVPKCPAQNINPGLQGSFFGDIFNCNSKDNGYLRFVWANNATTIPDGQILFTLCFDVIGDAGNTSPVSVNSNILEIEVCKEVSGRSICTVPLVTKSGSIKVTSSTLQLITSYCEAETGKKGSFTFYGTGGNPPYTYTVNSNEYTGSGLLDGQRVTIRNVVTKNYNVVITDGLGVSQTKLVPMDSISVGLRYNLTVQEPTCSTSKNGKIKLNTQPDLFGRTYLYQWSNLVSGRNLDSLIDLGAGKYFVTITNEITGCEIFDSTELRRAPINMGLTLQSPAACNQSGVFGFIEVNASGGVPKKVGNPYRIIINRGQNFGITPPYLLGQRAGRYEITVTDSLGCFKTDSIVIPFTSVLDMTAAKVDIECKGAKNGSAVITVGPYSKDYVYFGMNDLSRNALGPVSPRADTVKLNNLLPGFYQIRTTHGTNSCRDTVSFTITEPQDSLKIKPAIIQPGCNTLGSITLNPTGGTPGYSFKWNQSPADTLNNLLNLDVGNYQVTVTDANNCTATFTQMLNSAVKPQITAKSTNISCYGAKDGSLTVNIPVANGPFDIVWRDSTGNTTGIGQNLFNQGPGRYTVVVTDVNKCASVPQTVIISQPDSITYSKNITNARCFEENGNADIQVLGGNAGYTFEWKNASNQTIGRSDTISLKAGTYTVGITNSANCSKTDTVIIVQPAKIIFPRPDTIAARCFGVSDGRAAIFGSPLNFSWSNGTTAPFALNLPKGLHWVTAFDNSGCKSDTVYFIIGGPSKIELDQSMSITTNPKCFGESNGSVSVAAKGGTGTGFRYSWSNGRSGNFQDNLTAGKYIVTITDSANCINTDSVALNPPTEIKLNQRISHPSCDTLGSISINPTGGTKGYSYKWDIGATITSNLVTDLKGGNYNVTVTDSVGCNVTATFKLNEYNTSQFPKTTDDVLYVSSGNIYEINPISNDEIKINNPLLILGKFPPEFIKIVSISSNGVIKFEVKDDFTESILIDISVCDPCKNCSTSKLILMNEKLKNMVFTTLITPLEGANQSLQFSDGPISDSELWVYNRWGQQVFHTKGYQNDWNADGVPGGVYYYVFKVYGFTIKKALTVVK